MVLSADAHLCPAKRDSRRRSTVNLPTNLPDDDAVSFEKFQVRFRNHSLYDGHELRGMSLP